MEVPMSLKLLVLVPALALCHGPFRGSESRKLWNFNAEENHIWGKCDNWDSTVTGCELNSAYKCNSFNSQGPQEYDMEITLGDLPPSRPGNPVHLQWWTPRKSITKWNPHVSLSGCAVYWDIWSAYPKYNDADFNGGNQEVGTDGTVKIRFQTPSSYFLNAFKGIFAWPHVHLRLCSNDTFAHTTVDAIMFVDKGPELYAGEGTTGMKILNVKNFSFNEELGGNIRGNKWIATTMWLSKDHPSKTTTPIPDGEVAEIIADELERMNWDALEFSPIYQCFEQNQLFDHFTAECTSSCGTDREVARGQCVLPSRDATVEAVATWKVQATCNEACWQEWKNKTLHFTRLAVADSLNIPFQEVMRAGLTFHEVNAGNGRRLSERWATVQVYVNTRRLTLVEINGLMPQVFSTPAETTEIFNFPVSRVELTRLANDNQWPDMKLSPSDTTDTVDSQNDPFEGAYNDREPRGGVQTIGGIPTGDLPLGLVVGVAVAVLILGFGVGFCIFWRRKKAITQLGADGRVVTAAGTVIGSGANPAGKKVDDNGVPATANEDLARKAQDPW